MFGPLLVEFVHPLGLCDTVNEATGERCAIKNCWVRMI